MKLYSLYIILISLFFLGVTSTSYARCAVCYTDGMSGASIALIVIISSFIILFLSSKILKKFINKKN